MLSINITTEFQKIAELEKARKITIGVNKNHANTFWDRRTVVGKLLNWVTPLLVVFSIFVFIKYGFINGIFAVIVLVVYVLLLDKIGAMYARITLLKNEELFNAAYEAKSITIRNNSTKEVIHYPADWKTKIVNL